MEFNKKPQVAKLVSMLHMDQSNFVYFLADLVASTPFNILPRHPFSSSYQLRKQLIGDSEVRIEGEKRRRGMPEE